MQETCRFFEKNTNSYTFMITQEFIDFQTTTSLHSFTLVLTKLLF